jgi:hypothetical protein
VFIFEGGDLGLKATLPRSMGGGLGTLKIKGTFCPTGGHSEGGGTWDLRQKVWRRRGGDLGLVFETP